LPALLAGRREPKLPVKTKSIYEPSEPEDGVRVLVTRYYPRGVKKDRFDEWLRPLSPSRELLSDYRSGKKSWGRFKESFLSEMRANPDSVEAIRRLAALSQDEDVTLLCYERAGLPCHRLLVRDVIAAPGLLSTHLQSRVAHESEQMLRAGLRTLLRLEVAPEPLRHGMVSFYSSLRHTRGQRKRRRLKRQNRAKATLLRGLNKAGPMEKMKHNAYRELVLGIRLNVNAISNS